jgi:hypothetical protein
MLPRLALSLLLCLTGGLCWLVTCHSSRVGAGQGAPSDGKQSTLKELLSPDLAPPVCLRSGGKPIDVEIGHAAPFVADLPGAGKVTLLVGQFGGGKVQLFPMTKTDTGYELGKPSWLRAGEKLCIVPTG